MLKNFMPQSQGSSIILSHGVPPIHSETVLKLSISLSPWQELYDLTMNDIVTTTTNSALNGKSNGKLLESLA